jgi:prostaglandin-H2 D-isomerase / glutathione transferase
MSKSSIKLTYFDIEGVAEPVRLAFAFANIKYEDIRITHADWPTLKPTTPYGQLPVLTIDGGPMQAQSGAMIRWIGHQSALSSSSSSSTAVNLYPSDKLWDIEEAMGVIQDMWSSWTPCSFFRWYPDKYGHPKTVFDTDEGNKIIENMIMECVTSLFFL